MTEHLEIVIFTVKDGERDAFLAKRPAVMEALRANFDGVLDARLAEYEDGSFVDVIRWRSLEQAKAAAEGFGKIDVAQDWMQHIDEVRDFRHARLHDLSNAAAA